MTLTASPARDAHARTVRVLVPLACGPACDHDHLPDVVTITTDASCPTCGGPRGPFSEWQAGLDGAVDVRQNPCGHPDLYVDVARAAGVDVATGPQL